MAMRLRDRLATIHVRDLSLPAMAALSRTAIGDPQMHDLRTWLVVYCGFSRDEVSRVGAQTMRMFGKRLAEEAIALQDEPQ